MLLTTDEIREYQNIHEKIYWVHLSDGEALESGTKLIVFLEAIFKH